MLTFVPEVDIPNFGSSLVIWMVVGFITGWLAIRVLRGKGNLRYLAGGVVGGVLGSYLINAMHIRLPLGPYWAHHLVTALIGAAVAVLLVKIFE